MFSIDSDFKYHQSIEQTQTTQTRQTSALSAPLSTDAPSPPVHIHFDQETTILKIPDSIVLALMKRYLRPLEAVRIMLTCRHFHFYSLSDTLWQDLCKLQRPLGWEDDPFHRQIAQIQEPAKRALGYNRLFDLHAQKCQEPWKIKATIHLKNRANLFTTLAVLSNGNIVTGKNAIQIWSRADARVSKFSPPTDLFISQIAALTGGGFITLMPASHRAYIWSDTGKLLTTLEHNGGVQCIKILNEEIITGSDDTEVRRWKPDGTLVKTYRGHTSSVQKIVILQDGALATIARDNRVIIWSVDGRNPVVTFEHPGCTDMAGLMSGGIVTISKNGDGIIWSPAGKPISTFKHLSPSSWAMYITVLRNGNIVTVGNREGPCLWTPDGKLITALEGHTREINSIVPLSYGFITVSSDHTARIWSMTGECIATLNGHSYYVTAVAVFSKGDWEGDIATLGWDDKICIWSVDVERLLRVRSVWDNFTCTVS